MNIPLRERNNAIYSCRVHKKMKLREIGNTFNLSVERVRQIITKIQRRAKYREQYPTFPDNTKIFDVTNVDNGMYIRLSNAHRESNRSMDFWEFIFLPDKELLQIRNVGRKCLYLIEELREEYKKRNLWKTHI